MKFINRLNAGILSSLSIEDFGYFGYIADGRESVFTSTFPRSSWCIDNCSVNCSVNWGLDYSGSVPFGWI